MAHLHNMSRGTKPTWLSKVGNRVKTIAEIAGTAKGLGCRAGYLSGHPDLWTYGSTRAPHHSARGSCYWCGVVKYLSYYIYRYTCLGS